MTTIGAPTDRHSTTDTVAGFLAVFSMVLSAIALHVGFILQIDARPVRTSIAAALLALLAARLSGRYQSLAFKALIFASIAWVGGLTIAVLTKAPLF